MPSFKPTNPVNFDANASYGLLQQVAQELKISTYLNPSSIHSGGQKARAAIEIAREEISSFLGLAKGDRVIFTSGATEANNMAVMLPFWQKREGGGSCVTTAIEHPSVLEPIKRLSETGIKITHISPDPKGRFNSTEFVDAITLETQLLSLMAANNEVGFKLPVSEIAAAARSKNPKVLVHCDGVQVLGKTTLGFKDLGVDMLSISAHKIGGLAGVGALVVSENVACHPFIIGGSQETRWRAGTENVLGIISFGLAIKAIRGALNERIAAMAQYRDEVEGYLLARLPDCQIHCAGADLLPNTLSIRFPGIRADDLVVALDLDGVLVSSGAACASGKPEPSHVLLALGLDEQQARSTIRISLKAEYAPGEIEYACERIVARVLAIRSSLGSPLGSMDAV